MTINGCKWEFLPEDFKSKPCAFCGQETRGHLLGLLIVIHCCEPCYEETNRDRFDDVINRAMAAAQKRRAEANTVQCPNCLRCFDGSAHGRTSPRNSSSY